MVELGTHYSNGRGPSSLLARTIHVSTLGWFLYVSTTPLDFHSAPQFLLEVAWREVLHHILGTVAIGFLGVYVLCGDKGRDSALWTYLLAAITAECLQSFILSRHAAAADIASNLFGFWLGWQLACRFRAPLYFEDQVETHLLVQEVSEKTIKYVFYFRRCLGDDSKPIVATGEVTIACVAIQDGRAKMKGVPVPAALRERLEVAPEKLLNE